MRILGISGSPRGQQSDSRKLIERVLESAKAAGADVELVDLGKINMHYCVACGNCHVKGVCSLNDDIEPLREKMHAADGLVLGSPLYFNCVTAQLKTVLDRLSHEIHCQDFLGKYACSVATAGSPEHEIVLNYMNDGLVRLGYTVVGGTGAAPAFPGALDAALEEASELGRDLVQAISEKRTYPDQEAMHATMHERFKRLITFNKDNWPDEYECWKSKNWL